MTLTAAGQRLLAEAQRTIAAAQSLQSTAAQIRRQAPGVVRMGTVSDPVSLRLIEVFVRLAERHPQVALQLQQSVSLRAIQTVRRGDLDCAYVMDEHERLDGLDVRRLSPLDVVVVLPPQRAASGPPASIDELTRWPWVTTPVDCGRRLQLEALFRAAGRDLPSAAMADTEGAVRGMVASGFGAGLMRRDQAEEAERHRQGSSARAGGVAPGLCWVGLDIDPGIPAVAAVREPIALAWAEAMPKLAAPPATRA
jgi:DNA-binding transcriptional LysR family regulator